MRAYTKARELGCEESEIEFWLGKLEISHGDHPAATRHLLRTLELTPDYLEAHFNLGVALSGAERAAEAIQCFETVLRLKPGFEPASRALARLSQATPDLLICDLMMPFMDGATLCQQIRRDPKHEHMRIVLASVMDRKMVDSEAGVYDGFLRKPFHLATLLDLVSNLTREECRIASDD